MNFKHFLSLPLISLGAIIGTNLRYFIFSYFKSINLIKRFRILLINILASFCLGIFYPYFNVDSSQDKKSFLSFFLIGFIGSLSTYSSFIDDIFKLIYKKNYKSLIFFIFLSLFMGLSFFYIGYNINLT